ncbi:HMG box other [Lentinula edodes]|uniref:HMG box other n=1 Tax=Lentinula edodes TaxID=5353 RepID=A0A1Q3ERJ1_LENED|nr:uncharacterized protein C8R40DRAFT_823379 [Lentinula edodes]KAH7868539.1 hypothetical protein C8R40DRAFT_823379 [Lentinula edodes]GAW09828.1 HMG box other [Lentinula edodes]
MPKVKQSSASHKIPRPRNAFMIFRGENLELLKANTGINKPTQMDISREAGKLWRALGPAGQEEYHARAQQEKEEHARKYPGYFYKPRTKQQIADAKAEKARGKPVANAKRSARHSDDDDYEGSSFRSSFSPSSMGSSDFSGADSSPSPFYSGESWGSSSLDSGSREVSPYSNGAPPPFAGADTWILDPKFQASLAGYEVYNSPLESTPMAATFSQQQQQSLGTSVYSPTSDDELFKAAFDTLLSNEYFDPTTIASGSSAPEFNPFAFNSNQFDLSTNPMDFLSGSTDQNFPLINNVNTGGDVDYTTDLLPELDPSLVPGSYFQREELYQPQQSIDYQLECYRLPSFDS